MAEFDEQTRRWLQSLKLNKTLNSVNDFQNGYHFGTIFDKLQLSRGKKFKNSSDLACIFQNYKNVRDLLLENFNCDFPVNNIIYRTADLLTAIKDQTTKYLQQKKIRTMKAATSISSFPDKSLLLPQEEKQFKTREKQISGSATYFNQTSKMPRKIQDIQKKLDKYRQEKTRHELVALQQRKQELQQYRRVVMNSRDYEINKVKKLHQQTKQKQKKVYDVWYKTEQIKKNRIEIDQNLSNFQRSKRDKLLDSLRQQQIDFINKGQQMFELNCIRQGIQLEHDPDKPPKPEGEFNKIVVMQRIKDNIIKNEVDKKERIKRENKKRIEAEQAKIQSELLWNEINKIQDYSKKFSAHFQVCQSAYKVEKRMEAEHQNRKQKCKHKKYVDLPAYQDQEKRQQEFRQRKIQYLFNDVKWMEKKWKKNYSIAEQVVEALLQATIQGEQIFQKNQGFYYNEWKFIENKFLNFQDTRKKKNKDTKLYTDYSAFNLSLKQYLKEEGSWKNYQEQKMITQIPQNGQLIQTISSLIQKTYPDKVAPQIEKVPLYMPLKVIFNGPKLSGKSSHSAKLAEKYGLIIINPRQIIKQAIDLAKPPVEEDPKKGAKKDTKKIEEPTPEKLALKQFGIKLMETITSLEEATIQHMIAAIRFKLLQSFAEKSQQQIVEQYYAAKQKEKIRHEQALRDFQQAQKKPKKDSKKGAAEPVAQEPPKQNTCFYSSGFVIDDFPLNEQSIKQLQKQLNRYVSDEERINKDAGNIKQEMKLVIQIPQAPKDTRLKSGTFDVLVELSVEQQTLMKRKIGRKIDPQTKIIYHPTFNPPPDIKGFSDKLAQLPTLEDQKIKSSLEVYKNNIYKIHQFYEVFGVEGRKLKSHYQIQEGQQSVGQTFDKINKFIESILEAKYQALQKGGKQIKKASHQQNQNKTVIEQGQQLDEENKKTEDNKNELQLLSLKQIITSKLSKQDSNFLLEKVTGTVKKYQEGVKECLFGLDLERTNFMKELFLVQKNFTNIINRPDDKAGKILGFQENYNKLLSQQGNVVKDIEASKHLIQRLKQLYDSLWQAIGSKKNEAVDQRLKFKESNWLNTQSQKIVQTLKTLLQIELNYLCEVIFIILLFSCKIQGKSSDYMTEYLSLGIAPQLQPIRTVDEDAKDLVTNKRLEYYVNQTNKCLETLQAWIEKMQKKMKINKVPAINNLMAQFVQSTVFEIKKKTNNIKKKANERVLEQRSYYQTLINKMDDWIIQGIKAENDFVYEIYKNIKKCIEEAKRSNVKQLHVRQITDVLYPIKQLALYPIPLRTETNHRKIPVYSYMIFLQQAKTLANNDGKINFQIFKKYMDKRKKSQLLDGHILKINYDTVSQFLVKDYYLELRQLAIATLLWDIDVFNDDQLAIYKSKLLKREQPSEQKLFKQSLANKQINLQEQEMTEKSVIKKKKMSVISAFPTQQRIRFNQLILMDHAFDEEEQYIIKHLIFQIFREDGTDYIQAQNLLDTLSFFDEIQVLKYGDTVMLRNS